MAIILKDDVINLHAMSNLRCHIGILGGSFYPPHEGHIHISKCAMEALKLDKVWWLVAKQNPLKPPYTMSFDQRVEKIKELLQEYEVEYVDINLLELDIESCLTVDVLQYILSLTKESDAVHYTWIMGADMITHFFSWEGAEEILSMIDIAVFSRTDYSSEAKNLLASNDLYLSYQDKITFFDYPEVDISSTKIRNGV